MNARIRIIFAALALLLTVACYAASTSDDLISMKEDTSFPDAMSIIEAKLKADDGRIILDFSGYTGPIGINIDRLHWKAAFVSILTANECEYTESPKAWFVRPIPKVVDKTETGPLKPVIPDEVLIEVTIFEADQSALKESGVDWSTLSNGKVDVSTQFMGSSLVTSDLFSLQFNKTLDTGSGTVDLNALLKVFEAQNKGHVLARPQVAVASGEEATMQDGTNYSIKTKDEAGNVTDKFFDTGTIIKCTPNVVEADSQKYVHLKVSVERSSAEPSTVSTTEKITKTETIKMMYDGEETVISGLSTKEKTMVRKGIPFLKDLPWWVFGIRYLTGYNNDSTTNKEIIVILKTTILKYPKDRRLQRSDTEKQIQEMRNQMPVMENKLTQ